MDRCPPGHGCNLDQRVTGSLFKYFFVRLLFDSAVGGFSESRIHEMYPPVIKKRAYCKKGSVSPIPNASVMRGKTGVLFVQPPCTPTDLKKCLPKAYNSVFQIRLKSSDYHKSRALWDFRERV